MPDASPPNDRQIHSKVSVHRRAADPGTVTASAAGAALQHVVEQRERRRQGHASRPGSGSGRCARPTRDRRPTWAVPAVAWRAARVIVAVGVLAVIGQAVAGVAGRRAGGRDASLCGISGTVVFEGRPLAQAMLELHPLAGGRPLPVETDDTGGFSRPASSGVACGRYAVVVRSGCLMPRAGAEFGRPVAIPSRYARPDSTPLQIAVSSAARFDLVVAR